MHDRNITKKSCVNPKYTIGGQGKGGTTRHGGIINDGKEQFNNLFRLVEVKRKNWDREDMEETIKQNMMERFLGRKKRKKEDGYGIFSQTSAIKTILKCYLLHHVGL